MAKKKGKQDKPKVIQETKQYLANEFTIIQSSARMTNINRVEMNINEMKRLRINTGDLLRLNSLDNQASAIGIAWPNFNADNCLSVCEIIYNAEIALIERTKHSVKILESISLINNDAYKCTETLLIHLTQLLQDIEYFVHGQTIQISFDAKKLKFTIDSPQNDNHVLRIDKSTIINIQKVSEERVTETVHVAGLDKEICEIKNMINTALFDPDRFFKYNLQPPKGLILYGPSGTGKTLICRSICQEMNCNVITVNGPEILSKYYGETEQKLKSIFEEATMNSPSIIFFDEIDAICPSRDDSLSDLGKRIVTCLLVLMDGYSGSSTKSGKKANNHQPVFVIGATNRPNAIDIALRRPGRFDREIEIGIPSKEARYEILAIMSKDIHHSLSDQDLKHLASITHGYVGADLAAIYREAGLHAIHRVKKDLFNQDDFSLSSDSRLCINLKDMEVGMSKTKPSVMRQIDLKVPQVYWEDIGGQEEIKQKLKETIEWPLKNPEVFKKFNIRPPKGILMYGPPGCSKTLMAKALATEAGLNFLAVKGPELFSKWVGESEKQVQQIFKKARQASPSIIFFDEIDALAARRAGSESSVSDRVLSQLLAEMDGIEPLVNVTIIAATNRPDIIDSALLRPGRFDSIIHVPPPNLATRSKIFKIQLEKIPCSSDVNSDELAELTEGFSGAETVAVCQQACLSAMEDDINVEIIHRKYFLNAINNTTKRITSEMIEFYKEFEERSGLRAV